MPPRDMGYCEIGWHRKGIPRETRHLCGWHGCEQEKIAPDIEYSEFFILPGTDVLKRRMPPRGKCARLVA